MLRLIPFEKRSNFTCAKCGTSRSVKYEIDVELVNQDAIVSYPICSGCAIDLIILPDRMIHIDGNARINY